MERTSPHQSGIANKSKPQIKETQPERNEDREKAMNTIGANKPNKPTPRGSAKTERRHELVRIHGYRQTRLENPSRSHKTPWTDTDPHKTPTLKDTEIQVHEIRGSARPLKATAHTLLKKQKNTKKNELS
jgi:hypothetical protein